MLKARRNYALTHQFRQTQENLRIFELEHHLLNAILITHFFFFIIILDFKNLYFFLLKKKLREENLSILAEELKCKWCYLIFWIYKVIEISSMESLNPSQTLEVQIIPEDNTHRFYSNISSFMVYLWVYYKRAKYDKQIYQEIIVNSSNINYDPDTGILTISAPQAQLCFEALQDVKGTSQPIYKTAFILEASVEKHARADGSEAYNRIATMQAVSATILEYLCQYQVSSEKAGRIGIYGKSNRCQHVGIYGCRTISV